MSGVRGSMSFYTCHILMVRGIFKPLLFTRHWTYVNKSNSHINKYCCTSADSSPTLQESRICRRTGGPGWQEVQEGRRCRRAGDAGGQEMQKGRRGMRRHTVVQEEDISRDLPGRGFQYQSVTKRETEKTRRTTRR